MTIDPQTSSTMRSDELHWAITELPGHLRAISNAPSSTRLDVKSVDQFRVGFSHVVATASPAKLEEAKGIASTMLPLICQALALLEEDPTPLALLGQSVIEVLTYSEILALLPLRSAMPQRGLKGTGDPELNANGAVESVQLLILSILKRAAKADRATVEDGVLVAQDVDFVLILVETWLTATSVNVGKSAFEVIVSLLEVEKARGEPAANMPSGEGKGNGAFWHVMFENERVYERLFYFCNPVSTQLSKRAKSIAQSRLMSLVAKIAFLDWTIVSRPCCPQVESKYSCATLLEFATVRMVDQDDILLAANHIDFLRDLMVARSPETPPGSSTSPPLEYLVNSGLHQKILDFYLEPLTMDQSFASLLIGGVVKYFASYALTYPRHICQQPASFSEKLLSRIATALKVSPVKYAGDFVPHHDLELLSSLPRSLLANVEPTRNPLHFIPTNTHNQSAFDVLAAIFHGPPQASNNETDAWRIAEGSAARRMYLTYLSSSNPGLWQDVVTAADITALPDVASSAISLIASILSAEWPISDPGSGSQTETETTGDTVAGPITGLQALLTNSVLTTVFPWLMKPPPATATTSQGSDVVWRIASEKYDLVKSFRIRMDAVDAKDARLAIEGFSDLRRKVEERFAAGRIFPYEGSSLPGGEVATMGF